MEGVLPPVEQALVPVVEEEQEDSDFLGTWKEFHKDGAYALPEHLELNNRHMQARARMQQLSMAMEDGDPKAHLFGRLNKKVATWSNGYASSIKSGMVEPLALEPLENRPPNPFDFAPLQAVERIANAESPPPPLDVSHSLVVFPQPPDVPQLPMNALLTKDPKQMTSLDATSPRPLFITSGEAEAMGVSGAYSPSPRLAPLQVEAARAIAAAQDMALAVSRMPDADAASKTKLWPPQPDPLPPPDYELRSRHWTDMIRHTPNLKELPGETQQTVEQLKTALWAPAQKHFLPLSQFDLQNQTDEEKNSSSAVAVYRGKGAKAKSRWTHFGGKTTEWAPCQVVAVSQNQQQFLIEWNSNGKQKWVSCLNILFEGDSEEDLDRRLRAAEDGREKTESEMLRKMQIQRLPVDGAAAMPQWLQDNIRERIGRLAKGMQLSMYSTEDKELRLGVGWTQSNGRWIRHLSHPSEETLNALFREVTDGLVYTNNEVIFDSSMALSVADMSVEEQHEAIREMQNIQATSSISASSGAASSEAWECCNRGMVKERTALFERTGIIGSKFLVKALQAIHSYMEDIRNMDLFGVEGFKGATPRTASSRHSTNRPHSSAQQDAASDTDDELVAFLDTTENRMMITLQEISNRVLSNACNIVNDAADEEVSWLISTGASPSEVDLPAYEHLLEITNMMIQFVLRKLVAQSIRRYTDIVMESAERLSSRPLFFTNMEEVEGKIVFNPPLETFTERIIGTIVHAVQAVNATKGLAQTPAFPWRPESGMPPFTVSLSKTFNTVLSMEGPIVKTAVDSITAIMNKSQSSLNGLLESFREHDRLLGSGGDSQSMFLAQWKEHYGARLEDWDDCVAQYRTEEEEILSELPLQTNIGLYYINCARIKQELITGAQRFSETLLQELAGEALKFATECKDILSVIHAEIIKPTHNLEELHEILNKLQDIPAEVEEQQNKLQEVSARLEIIEKYHYNIDVNEFAVIWDALKLPGVISEASEERRVTAVAEEKQYTEELMVARTEFDGKLVDLVDKVAKWQDMDEEDEASLYVLDVTALAETLDNLHEESSLINGREVLVKLEPSDYRQIEELQKQLSPYVELWKLVSGFHSWTAKWKYGPLFSFNLDTLQKQIPLWVKTVFKLEKILTAGPYRVITKNKAQLEELQECLPLIMCLRTPGVRERHWKVLNEIMGIDPSFERRTWTMEVMIQLGVKERIEEISKVVDVAVKESVIEKAIDKIDAEFSSKEIDLRTHGRNQTEIMHGGDDLLLHLDDNILRLQTLVMSPFAIPHKDRLVYWELALKGVRSLVSLWMEVQNRWQHAELLFNNDTTVRQMPMEARRFAVIDTMWRNIVADTRHFPNLIEISQRVGLTERLEDARHRLTQINKGMHEFLNLKRAQFARFNFLSNNELFEMLELSMNPAEVEPYMEKVFHGAAKMVFDAADHAKCKLIGIESHDQEVLSFLKPVILKAPTGIPMEIDQWMFGIEMHMKDAVLDDVEKCIGTYGAGNYSDWLMASCGQAVVVVSSMVWANEVTNILETVKESVEESKRVRTTIHGSRGSFLSDADEHGVGARRIERRFRHASIVEESIPDMGEEDDETEEEEAPLSPGSDGSQSDGPHLPGGPKPTSDFRVTKYHTVASPMMKKFALQPDSPGAQEKSSRASKSKLKRSTVALNPDQKAPVFGLGGRRASSTTPTVLDSSSTGVMFSYLLQRMAAEMTELFNLVSMPQASHARITLTNLIVTKAYHRDTIGQLIEEKVENEADFEWLRQVRYEFQPEVAETRQKKAVLVRSMDTCSQYGCEYLGTHSRIVVTPLTERVYNTLLSAISLHKGGLCEGPSGTGKSETVKELSRLAAKVSVVYNCSSTMDIPSILKILMGVVACGAWICFDDLNRLEMGVLSVLSKHIQGILMEIAAGNTKIGLLSGQGKGTLILDPSMAVFVASNPSASVGREDLPANTRSLFRPVAMMVPDTGIIAEVILFAAGFARAGEAAHQVVGCLELASQRLSRAKHYDFGMRTLKKVLQKCQELKQQSINDPRQNSSESKEMLLCQKAIMRVVIPGLVQQDVSAFEGLAMSAFPGERSSRGDNLNMIKTVRQVLADKPDIHVSTQVIRNVVQLYDIMDMQTGVMLLGHPGCGKTTLRDIVALTLKELANQKEQELEISTTTLYPRALSHGRFLGTMEPGADSALWKDGVLTSMLRKMSNAKPQEQHWLVLDSQVDGSWFDDLNTLLDDEGSISLASGETLSIHHGVKIFFETDSIANASPASIGRVGLLHMPEDSENWKFMLSCWVNAISIPALEPFTNKIDVMITAFCTPLLKFLSFPGRSVLKQTQSSMIRSLLNLLDAQLFNVEYDTWADLGHRDLNVMIECFTMFAIIWSIGANCVKEERTEFSELFHKLSRKELSYQSKTKGVEMVAHMRGGVLVPIGEGAPVFEYYFDAATQTWQTWAGLAYAQAPLVTNEIMVVPTGESMARMQAMQLYFLKPDSHIMLAGPAGSGKTLLASWFMNIAQPYLVEKQDDEAPEQLSAEEQLHQRSLKLLTDLGLNDELDSALEDHSDEAPANFDSNGKPSEKELPGGPRKTIMRSALFSSMISLSSRSRVDKVQAAIESKLYKLGKGVYGPPSYTPGVIFVDDISMVGAQDEGTSSTPMELLRQWVGSGGWYERDDCVFRQVRNMRLIGSFTTGLTAQLSSRLLRHCHLVTVPYLSNASLGRIFKVMAEVGLEGSSVDVMREAGNLVQASCAVLREVSAHLLPVPTRPHYRFTVRELASVFRSILGASEPCRASPRRIATLWYHEMMRVIYDRLMDEEHQSWFMGLLTSVIGSYDVSLDKKGLGDPDGHEVIFCNFLKDCGDSYSPVIPFDDQLQEDRNQAREEHEIETAIDDLNSTFTSQVTDDSESSKTTPGLKKRSKSGKSMKGPLSSKKVVSKRGKSGSKMSKAEEASNLDPVEEDHSDDATDDKSGSQLYRKPAMMRRDAVSKQRELRMQLLAAESGTDTESLLSELLECYQVEFCYQNPKQPLNLIMFRAAISHVSRIARVLSQPHGHLLLIGNAANAVRSLSRLATFLAGHKYLEVLMQPGYSHTQWQQDVKEAMKIAGLQGHGAVLLFKDSPHFEAEILDDLVQLLIHGDLRALYTQEETDAIVANITAEYHAKLERDNPGNDSGQNSEAEYIKFFFQRVASNLRVLILMEPETDLFSSRIREFPQLVNCCHCSYIAAWGEQSLRQVAEAVLSKSDIIGPEGEYHPYQETAINACVEIHQSMIAVAEAFREVESGFQVGSTEFLEMLTQVPKTIAKTQSKVKALHDKYVEGVSNMRDLSDNIQKLEEALVAIQPAIQSSSDETERLLVKVEQEQEEANVMRAQLERDEAAEKIAAAEAQSLRDQCDADLENSMPPLRRALKELQTINKTDIAELKSLKNPPMGVKFVMKAICHMLGCIPQPVLDRRQLDPDVEDALWWRESMKLLGQINFLEVLLTFDKNSIPDEVITQVDYFTDQPEFNPKIISKVSRAATSLCRWVIAIDLYHDTKKVIIPKTEALKQAEAHMIEKQNRLDGKRASLAAVQTGLDDLRFRYESALAHREQLQKDLRHATDKVQRARKVLAALTNEKTRWEEEANDLSEKVKQAVGNCLLSSAYIAYAGGLDAKFRQVAMRKWKQLLLTLDIAHNPKFDFTKAMGNEALVSQWIDEGLPNSRNAIESAIIMEYSTRWPLVIDPEEQALNWITHHYESRHLVQLLTQTTDFQQSLNRALEKGYPVIIGNVGKDQASVVDQLIDRQIFKGPGDSLYIQMGPNKMPFDENFKAVLWSRLRPPMFSQDVQAKTAKINFSITKQQLVDDLVYVTLRHENPEMDKERHDLRRSRGKYKAALRETETGILDAIASKDAVAILDSTVVHSMLAEAQEAAHDLKLRLERVNQMEERISKVRERYRSGVAAKAAVLYFAVMDLSNLNYAYQFSLKSFYEIYAEALHRYQRPAVISERPEALWNHFVPLLYVTTCRSLFDCDKLPFALTMVIRLMRFKGIASKEELSLLAHGTAKNPSQSMLKKLKSLRHAKGAESDNRSASELYYSSDESLGSEDEQQRSPTRTATGSPATPTRSPGISTRRLLVRMNTSFSQGHLQMAPPAFIGEEQWAFLRELSRLPEFAGVLQRIAHSPDTWKEAIDSGRDMIENPPEPWVSELSLLHKVLFARALQPSRFSNAVKKLVREQLGDACVGIPPFDMEAAYDLSSSSVPLAFVLSPGVQPINMLMKYADFRRRRVLHVVLGKDQGGNAERMIRGYIQQGRWVILENCHLAGDWIHELAAIVDQLPNLGAHPEFRLWLTLEATQVIPKSILQASVKLMHAHPTGFKACLAGAIADLPGELLSDPELGSKKGAKLPSLQEPEDAPWRRIVMALCHFHAQVRERQTYGSLAWNLPYSFDDDNLTMSIEYLLSKYTCDDLNMKKKDAGMPGQVPQADSLASTSFVVGQCFFGGRITDCWDRRLLQVLLDDLLDNAANTFGEIEFAPGLPCSVNADAQLTTFVNAVEEMPEVPSEAEPALVGLHYTAHLHKRMTEYGNLIRGIRDMDRRESSRSGLRTEDTARLKAENMLSGLPLDVFSAGGNAAKGRWRMAKRLIGKALPSQTVAWKSEASRRKLLLDETFKKKQGGQMDEVLSMEKQLYTELLQTVRGTLSSIINILNGSEAMTDEMRTCMADLHMERVPQAWQNLARALDSSSLAAWMVDLELRLVFLRQWIRDGPPLAMPLGLLLVPTMFLAALKQEHAQQHGIPVGNINFDFQVLARSPTDRSSEVSGAQPSDTEQSPHGPRIEQLLSSSKSPMDDPSDAPLNYILDEDNYTVSNDGYMIPTEPPPVGWFVSGILLRGAAWDNANHCLTDPRPGAVLEEQLPIVWLIPSAAVQHEQSLVQEVDPIFQSGRYLCPLYHGMSASKRGPDSTRNAADMSIAVLPLPPGRGSSKQWVKRGASLVAGAAGIRRLPKSDGDPDDTITITLPKTHFNTPNVTAVEPQEQEPMASPRSPLLSQMRSQAGPS